jgi:hypothetical protein
MSRAARRWARLLAIYHRPRHVPEQALISKPISPAKMKEGLAQALRRPKTAPRAAPLPGGKAPSRLCQLSS